MILTKEKLLILLAAAWMTGVSATHASSAITLPTDGITPVGSGDVTKPGFAVRVNQIDVPGINALVGLTSRAEQQLAGIIATNSADLSSATNGFFIIPGIINWNQDVAAGGSGIEIGNFTSVSDPSRPDQPIPGIPGIGPNIAFNSENIAAELVTYLEFKTPGLYSMGVNSDDGFKVTATDQPPALNGALIVSGGPAAGSYYAVSGGTDAGGLSTPITSPINGQLIYAQGPDGCGPLTNAAQIAGNIALIDRGTCSFTDKIQHAKDAGAIAAIIVNSVDVDSPEGIYPTQMRGTAANLPAIMISKPDGAKLKSALTNGTVNVTLTADDEPRLAEFNGERTSADTIFSFNVSEAGVYPFRLVWFQDTGAANLEWFSVQDDGTKIPLNDPENPAALKAFRARTVNPVTRPHLSIARNANGSITITWDQTGTLEETTQLKNTGTVWTNTPNGTFKPITLNATNSAKFYRLLGQ